MRPYLFAGIAALVLFSVASALFVLGVGSGAGQGSATPGDLTLPESPSHSSQVSGGLGGPPASGPPPSPGGLPAPAGEVPPAQAELPGGTESVPLHAGECVLVVVVRTPDLEPLAGVFVTLLAGRSAGEAATDATGACLFAGIAPGSYSLQLDAPGLGRMESARVITLETGEERELLLTLPRFDLSISGRVLNHEGRPVPGIVVGAERYLVAATESDLVPLDREELAATSGPEGRYEIRGLEAADYVVSTRATSEYPAARRVFRSGATSADLNLAASVRFEVFGRVLDGAGNPLAGIRVGTLGAFGASTTSDAAGAYRLELQVPSHTEACVLKAAGEGYSEARVNVPLGGEAGVTAREIDLHLELAGATGEVSGWIFDDAGEPVRSEAVHLYSSQLRTRYQAVSREDGSFQFEAVEAADDYKLWVYPRAEYEDYARRSVAVGADGLKVEIQLQRVPTGRVLGIVVDPLGNPVSGFVFWLRSTKAQGRSVSVTTDATGRFEALDVAVGKLVFETRSLPRFTVKGLTLEEGVDLEARLVVDWGAETLRGTVVDPDGAPVVGAKVNLLWTHKDDEQQSVAFRHAVTDAFGRFSFSQLASGLHRIHVVASKFRGAQVSYRVAEETTEPVIQLSRSSESAPGR